MNASDLKKLQKQLPHWQFEFYGHEAEKNQQGAVACFPPRELGMGHIAYLELKGAAFITSVCGPFYLVTNLK